MAFSPLRSILPSTSAVSKRLTQPPTTLLSTVAAPSLSDSFSVDSLYPLPDQRFNVSLSSYSKLTLLPRGGYDASEAFKATAIDGSEHSFRILMYPRGGASGAKANSEQHARRNDQAMENKSGFGMSYKVLPMFQDPQERVAIYLQYLPNKDDDTVDATFDIRLKGQQVSQRKFDIEWSAGMRFVKNGKLADGTACDFGAHLMQTALLERFMGAHDGNDNPLQVQVRLTLHPTCNIQKQSLSRSPSWRFDDIRRLNEHMDVHNTDQVRIGKVVVPILQKLSQRPLMFQVGAYPGVEYRIMRIFSKDGYEIFGSEPGAEYELKPIYPLVKQLERQWPVRVKEQTIPKLLTSNMYNTVSAVGSLFTAVFGLFAAFTVSQLISFFVIPSRSMDPTLLVGDVLLVEKVSPRILRGNNHKGDVVLFHPPSRLQEIVSANGGGHYLTDRDLFVKRVAAESGDIVTVDVSGNVKIKGDSSSSHVQGRRDLCETEPLKLIEKYIQPGEILIPPNQVFVAGDCGSVSIDSRVWGSLPTDEIVGKPLFRVWPLERFGRIAALPVAPIETEDW